MPVSGVPLGESSLPELLFWLMRIRRRFRVTGSSMEPLLQSGDHILVDPRAYRTGTPRPGDIVVAQHPFRTGLRLVKRVTGQAQGRGYILHGLDPFDSTDSRSLGPFPITAILGRVTSRMA